MCMSCGCWVDPEGKMGNDGAHPEDSTVMPNIKTTVADNANDWRK